MSLEPVPSYEWNGRKYPSLVDAVHAAEAVLFFAPESNGEVAYRGFKDRERKSGYPWRIWRRALVASAIVLPTLAISLAVF